MHVFFDDQVFHLQRHGGISRYICGLATALAQHENVSVTLFGSYTTNEPIESVLPGERLRKIHLARRDNLRISKSVKRLSRFWRRWEFLGARRRHGAVVYHPSAYEVDSFIHQRAAGTVVMVHDLIDELFGDGSRHNLHSIQNKRQSFQLAHRLVCNSRSTLLDLTRIYPDVAARASVTYIASDLAPAPLAGETSPTPFFLVVGNREVYKNGRIALAAFAQIASAHPLVRLRICGPKLSAEEAALLGPALAARVDHPAMDDATLARSYQTALALVYPSRYEGFGLPVHEAMKLGCPVITTRCSSLPEVAGDAALFLEKDSSPAELAVHLTSLLQRPEIYIRLHQLGPQQASKFTVERTTVETLSVYRDMLASPKS